MDQDAAGRNVGLDLSEIVLDGDPAPHPEKGGQSPLLILSPCLLWPNGWVDQDPICYGGRPRPRPHFARWDPASPPKKEGGTALRQF